MKVTGAAARSRAQASARDRPPANTGIIAGTFAVLAALGGFGLLSFHMRGRTLPNGLVVAHGLPAVAAFLILLAAVFVMGT